MQHYMNIVCRSESIGLHAKCIIGWKYYLVLKNSLTSL